MNANLVNLAGKVAIVTSEGVGMGAATARLLAARGAKRPFVALDLREARGIGFQPISAHS